MILAGTHPEPFSRLMDAIGTASFFTDLGRYLCSSFGVDAFAIHELDERRKSFVALTQGCADERVAALLGPRPQLCSPAEISSRFRDGEPWMSAPTAVSTLPDLEAPAERTALHALLAREGSLSVVLSLARLGAERALDHGDRKRVREAMPMLRSLWRAHARTVGFEAERNAIFEALSFRGVGAITLDAAAAAISVNRRAAELMTETGALRLSHSGLYTNDPLQMHSLQAALDAIFAELRQGTRAGIRSITFSSATTQRSLKMNLFPIPVGLPKSGTRNPVIVALLTDPQADVRPHVRETARIFGLTVVETELVCHLVEGASLDTAATYLRVSAHTVRKYLQQIFAKTGTGRQTDLVLLMVSGSSPGRATADRGSPRRLLPRAGVSALGAIGKPSPVRLQDDGGNPVGVLGAGTAEDRVRGKE